MRSWGPVPGGGTDGPLGDRAVATAPNESLYHSVAWQSCERLLRSRTATSFSLELRRWLPRCCLILMKVIASRPSSKVQRVIRRWATTDGKADLSQFAERLPRSLVSSGLLNEDAAEQQVRLLTRATRCLSLLDADYFASFIWDQDSQSFGHGVTINMDPANLAQLPSLLPVPRPHHPSAARAPGPDPCDPGDGAANRPRQEPNSSTTFSIGMVFITASICTLSQDSRHIGDLRIWRHRRRPAFQRGHHRSADHAESGAYGILAAPSCTRSTVLPPVERDRASCPTWHRSRICRCSESEVAERVCRGYSDKEIAAELNIGFSTVRSHLDRIFQKLERSHPYPADRPLANAERHLGTSLQHCALRYAVRAAGQVPPRSPRLPRSGVGPTDLGHRSPPRLAHHWPQCPAGIDKPGIPALLPGSVF